MSGRTQLNETDQNQFLSNPKWFCDSTVARAKTAMPAWENVFAFGCVALFCCSCFEVLGTSEPPNEIGFAPTLKIQPAPNSSLQPDFKAASLKTKIVTSSKTRLLALIWS